MITLLLSQDTKDLKTYWEENGGNIWLPEAGLHPAEFVNKTAPDLLDGCYSDNKVIATHSEALISYLGDLICQDQLDKNFVEVKVLHKGKVYDSYFDEEGCLVDWVCGFFNY